jgi:hypothetical protein
MKRHFFKIVIVITLLFIAHRCQVLTTSVHCHMVLISLNAVTKNKNTQNAVTLEEFWKKRRGATRSTCKENNTKDGYGKSSDVKNRCTQYMPG